jgi:tellurite resistance protein TerC
VSTIAISNLVVPTWAWLTLGVVMVTMVAIDLIAHRGDRAGTKRGAWIWTITWIVAALLFNLGIYLWFGAEPAQEFLAAYLLEKSLSVDNLFLFLVIFGALGIPRSEQRRVLTWGILGALVTRALFIAAGAAALERWHFVSYLFGAFLVITAVRLLREPKENPEQRLLSFLERHVPWTRDLHGHHFFVRQAGRWVATPLFLALIAIELTDVVFAIDSVPAAFAVTSEPFLVYSSNVFAILGLRALYTVLAGALAGIRYLRHGLAAVLAFAGVKMLGAEWFTLPPLVAVGVIIGCIGIAVIASLIATRRGADTSKSEPMSLP